MTDLGEEPFIAYCDCSVIYEGRAASSLERGYYLILYKKDKSILIHGGDKITAKNYQGSGSVLFFEQNKIISVNKREKLIITVYDLMYYMKMLEWSDNETKISKTEKELVEKLEQNLEKYIQVKCDKIVKEYKTPYGPVDLVGIKGNLYYVIEVKRRRCTIKDATQLRKYMECFDSATGYLAGPDISDNAIAYLQKYDCIYINVNFD